MTKRTLASLLALLAALALVLVGCSDDGDDSSATDDSTATGEGSDEASAGPTSAPPDEADGSLLAVLDAAGGSFAPSESGDGTYELTLTGVDASPVWFSDRPERHVGSFTVDQLDQAFFEDQTPPNAALEAQPAGDDDEGAGEPALVIVEISEPSWDEGDSTLTLQARMLGAEDVGEGSGLHDRAQQASDDVPSSFGPAVLFVDDSCETAAGPATLGSGTSCSTAQDVVNAFDPPIFCTNTPVDVGELAWTCEYPGDIEFTGLWPGGGGPTFGSFTVDPEG